MESVPLELMQKIANENAIGKFKVKIGDSVSKEGDGYLGILEGLDLIDEQDGKKLHLVIKKAPKSEALRKQFPIKKLFEREILFYKEIFPEFEKFQKECGILKPFDNTTVLYGSNEIELKEFLLLRNLIKDGYSTCDRRTPMDSAHLKLALKIYARLHAVSLAMKRLEPEKYAKCIDKIKPNIFLDLQGDSNFQLMMMEGMFRPTLLAIGDDPQLTKVIDRIKANFFQFFIAASNMDKNEFSVVTHSDCWSTNIMFKYQDGSPIDLKLIDWQTSCVSHPVFDLSYFLFINAAKPDLANYLNYLKYYHGILGDNLLNFGLDWTEFYPFELLEKQWKEYYYFGFFMCLVMMEQSLSDTKTHDFEKLAETGENIFDAKMKQIGPISDRFKKRMSDLLKFIDENSFFV